MHGKEIHIKLQWCKTLNPRFDKMLQAKFVWKGAKLLVKTKN